jgi:hypothetical protein
MKHIDVGWHNTPDLDSDMIVDYTYMHTNENMADILTKVLTKDEHKIFTKAMVLW